MSEEEFKEPVKNCEKCPNYGDDKDEYECELCMGYIDLEDPLEDMEDPFERIDFKVIGATEEEMGAMKQRFREILQKARDRGTLPADELGLRIFMVRVLHLVLNDHYDTY